MNIDDAKRYVSEIVDALDDSYTEFEVQLMGGEPLLRFKFIRELSEWLWQQNFKIPLVQVFAATNGTLLNAEMKKWFFEKKSKICLGLSFDGDSFMQNINRSDSYQKVDLDFFAQTWPNQNLKMTVSPLTLPQLFSGVKYLHEVGFRRIAADLAMGQKVAWKQSDLQILCDELQKLTDFYLQNPDIPRVSLLDVDIFSVLSENKTLKKCGCGEDLVCIDTDGRQYACHLFSPVSLPQEKAEKSRKIDFTRHDDFVPEQCKPCALLSICTICYGMNYLLHDDITAQNAFVCQAFKIQFLHSCNLFLQTKDINETDKSLIESVLSQIN